MRQLSLILVSWYHFILAIAAWATVSVADMGMNTEAYAVKKNDNGATIIRDEPCGILTGDGGFVITDDSKAVTMHSGNSHLQCKYHPK
jgi:hypothetical protein